MSAQDNGGPAFPVMAYAEESGTVRYHAAGMTLRDYFAAHAPSPQDSWHRGEKKTSDILEWPYWYADKMLKERAK